jgi:hypothetical protein
MSKANAARRRKIADARPATGDAPTPNGRLGAEHPLADSVGAFADDPLWELMMEEIQKHRLAEDADPTR